MADEEETPRAPRGGAARVGVLVAWVAATAGFVAYLTSLASFGDAYGSVGTGALLLVWITLFSILYHSTPKLRTARVEKSAAPFAGRPRPIVPPGARVDRIVAPSAALRNTAAQGRMMSVMGPRATELTARELDMLDWGFAFGVAWAVARRQDPGASEALVSERALHATQAVHRAYRGNGGLGRDVSAAQPHAHRS